jgi:hypothetical protein
MKKLVVKIFAALIILYILVQVLKPWFPNWLSILCNSDPKYINHALDEAKRAHNYDKYR